ncbi:MAG: hypothetical protein M9913_19660 [Bryobacteraceae bacterium]|nr:hypothetical protein [Solibacteraceae bacterium]MCO5353075.1 hypothetical protein [Bryobacteraceae bacterium]
MSTPKPVWRVSWPRPVQVRDSKWPGAVRAVIWPAGWQETMGVAPSSMEAGWCVDW